MRYPVISGFFDLELALNYGVVFGLPAPVWLTILVSLIAGTVVIWYLRTDRGRAPVVQLYLAFILSGVIGNLVDRLAIGAVRDFILLYVGKYPKEHRWPNFNIADAFILVGVVLAMIQFILTDEKKEAKQGDKAGGETAGKSAKSGTQ